MRIKLSIFFIITVLSFIVPAQILGEEKKIIRIAHELAYTHPKHIGAMKLKELVNKKFEGKLEIRVYGQGSLFRDTDALDAVMAGNLEICMPLGGNFAKWIPEMRITGLPNLTNSYEEVERFWTKSDIGKYLKQKMKAKGIKYLGFTYSGGFDGGIMSNSRILTLSDVKGKKIRIHSPSAKPFVDAWNANSIVISASELSTALQRNMIDGALSSVPHWLRCCKEESPYFTVGVVFSMPPHIVCTSEKFWNSLPDNIKEGLQGCIDEATEFTRKLKQQYDEELLSEYRVKLPSEKGIYLLSEADRKVWTKINITSYSLFEKILGEEVYDLAKKFMEAQ